MKTILGIAGICCALSSMNANAGWITGLTLTQVGSGDYAGEYVWFSTSQAVSNPAGCSNGNDIYVLRTLPKNALAILLSSKVSGSPIRLYVNDTQCDTSTGRPLVSEVGMQ